MIYTFDLVLNRPLTDNEAAKAYYGGLDDSYYGICGYLPTIRVNNEAPTFVQAIITSIKELECSVFGIKVQKIAAPDLVSIPQIADLTNTTRQNIYQLKIGQYGPGGWPPPVNPESDPKHQLWRFTDIADWWSTYKLDKNIDPIREHTIALINAKLRARYELSKLPENIAEEIQEMKVWIE